MKTFLVILFSLFALTARAQYQSTIGGTPTNGTSEVQRLTIGSTPLAAETFKLAWNGRPTASITWSATEAVLDSNLQHGLDGIFGVGNTLVVTNSLASGVGTININFQAAYAVKPVGGTMTVSYNGTSSTLAVTKPTPGVLASYRNAISGAQLIETDVPTTFVNTSLVRLAPTWTNTTVFNLGLTSLTQGDLVYASATNTWAQLAKSASATRYLSNTGSSNNPAWAQVNVANGVTGTLPVANGGTGVATATAHGILIGETTSAFASTSAGTAGQVLTSGGASADPGWTTSVPIANGGTGATTFSGAQTALGLATVRLAADTATTGQTLIGTPLQFTIGATDVWEFDIYINPTNSGTNGTKIGILLPASATTAAMAFGNVASVAAFTTDLITASNTAGANFNTSTATADVIWIHGTVTGVGTGGAVVLQFYATTSGTATIKAGSYLVARRIS